MNELARDDMSQETADRTWARYRDMSERDANKTHERYAVGDPPKVPGGPLASPPPLASPSILRTPKAISGFTKPSKIDPPLLSNLPPGPLGSTPRTRHVGANRQAASPINPPVGMRRPTAGNGRGQEKAIVHEDQRAAIAHDFIKHGKKRIGLVPRINGAVGNAVNVASRAVSGTRSPMFFRARDGHDPHATLADNAGVFLRTGNPNDLVRSYEGDHTDPFDAHSLTRQLAKKHGFEFPGDASPPQVKYARDANHDERHRNDGFNRDFNGGRPPSPAASRSEHGEGVERYAAETTIDWADDLTNEADGYGFNIGEMKDATEVDESERYAMDDDDDE